MYEFFEKLQTLVLNFSNVNSTTHTFSSKEKNAVVEKTISLAGTLKKLSLTLLSKLTSEGVSILQFLITTLYKYIATKNFTLSEEITNNVIEKCAQPNIVGEFVYVLTMLNREDVTILIVLIDSLTNFVPIDIFIEIHKFFINLLGTDYFNSLITNDEINLNETHKNNIALKLNAFLFNLREIMDIVLNNIMLPNAIEYCYHEKNKNKAIADIILKLENKCGNVFLTKIIIIVKEFISYILTNDNTATSKVKIIQIFGTLLYIINHIVINMPTWKDVIGNDRVIEEAEKDIFTDVPSVNTRSTKRSGGIKKNKRKHKRTYKKRRIIVKKNKSLST